MKQRVGLLSLALVVGSAVAASKGAGAVETALLLALAVCGVVYLVLRVREHRRERKA